MVRKIRLTQYIHHKARLLDSYEPVTRVRLYSMRVSYEATLEQT